MNLSPFKWMCAAWLFAIFSSTLSKSPVLPIFAVHLGAKASEVGIIAAVSTLAGIAFSIPAGMLSDRFGRKTMLIVAGVVFASAPAMYLFTTGIWPLAVIRSCHAWRRRFSCRLPWHMFQTCTRSPRGRNWVGFQQQPFWAGLWHP
jgi:MFS family permease